MFPAMVSVMSPLKMLLKPEQQWLYLSTNVIITNRNNSLIKSISDVLMHV